VLLVVELGGPSLDLSPATAAAALEVIPCMTGIRSVCEICTYIQRDFAHEGRVR